MGLMLLAGLAGLTGCKPNDGGATGTGNPIKVGEFASLSGKQADFGIASHEGTLLAVEQLNAAGGVLGRKIQLLTEDDLSKAGEPATVVNKLISREKVVAVLGEVASSPFAGSRAHLPAKSDPHDLALLHQSQGDRHG